MRSFLAALRTLVLPYGTTTGQRIVLDGVNGEIDAYDASNNKSIQIGPGPGILINGTGVIDITDPVSNKELSMLVQGGAGNTPEIVLSGSGTFASGSMSAVIQMDDLNDQKFRIFMGRRGQDDIRAAINQWDIEATRNYFRMTGYDTDFATPVNGWMYDPTPPGAIVPIVSGAKETWHNVALLNGWANRAGLDPLQYRFLPDGTVHLRGTIAGGAAANGTQIGSVPAPYRPPTHDTVVPISSDNLPAAYAAANGSPRLQIQLGGNMFIYGTGAGPLWIDTRWTAAT